MIGTRSAASAGVAILGLAVLLGPRLADPAVAIGAERVVRERCAAATSALGALRAAIEPGLEAARSAAAAIVSGDEPPGEEIVAAGHLLAEAEAAAGPARRAVASVGGARAAWRPGSDPLASPVEPGELASIGAQLRAAAPAADAFAEIRVRGVGLAAVLGEALRALERNDLAEAERFAVRAREDHALVVAWETDLPTVPVWLGTTDAMITAVEDMIEATREGDRQAALAAADRFAALGDDGATADRALRIALSEGGSALTAAPLERLAAVLRDIEASLATVAAISQAASR